MEHVELIPPGARPAARVLLIRPDLRLLLLEGADRLDHKTWWVAPGGGLKAEESFQAAAACELLEETGVSAPIGPWVWVRNHKYVFAGRPFHQHERFFVVRVGFTLATAVARPDAYVIGSRWWSLEEIRSSDEVFAPRRLPEFLPSILHGDYPRTAIDVGV